MPNVLNERDRLNRGGFLSVGYQGDGSLISLEGIIAAILGRPAHPILPNI